MQLTIEHWRGWMPGVSSTEQWQQWCQTAATHSDNSSVDVSAIPPMLRRRLSPMGRAATSRLMPLLPLLHNPSSTPIVFASRHGEVGRTQKMLCDLAADELLSPTAFSLSVHNAICGIISINQKVTANINAIAAAGSELMACLVEAGGLLSEDHCEQVLCVLCDEPLPAPYQPYCEQPEQPFALAFIASNSASPKAACTITLSATQQSSSQTTSPLQLIHLLCGEKTHIEASLNNRLWSIQRLC